MIHSVSLLMFIFTASNKKYKEILTETQDQYDRIYDLGDLGLGVPWHQPSNNSRQIRRWKPQYMLYTLLMTKRPCVWLDADSLALDSFSEMETEDYDIALVVRKRKEGNIKFKSATVFMQPTKAARKFLKRWSAAIPENGRGDQRYLRDIISEYYPLVHKTYEKNRILDVNGVRIKLLDRSTYCWEIKRIEEIDQVPEWAKVVHFSGWSGTRKHKQKMEIFRKYYRDIYSA